MSMTQVRQPGRPFYRYVVLALLIAIYILNFLDRQLLSILAQPIKAELNLADTQLGLLTVGCNAAASW